MDVDLYMINQLSNKFTCQPVLIDNLIVTDIRDYHPQDFFSDTADASRVKECYVLTPRQCEYGARWEGKNGYWERFEYPDGKPIGNFQVAGFKQKLRFCEGDMNNWGKTNWYMIEYRLKYHHCLVTCNHREGWVDDWVLCRVYQDFVPEDLASDMEDMNI